MTYTKLTTVGLFHSLRKKLNIKTCFKEDYWEDIENIIRFKVKVV